MDYRDNPNHKPKGGGQIWTPIGGQLSLPIDSQSFGDRERLHFDHNNAKERVPIMAQTGA
jgi:hypothetical protein